MSLFLEKFLVVIKTKPYVLPVLIIGLTGLVCASLILNRPNIQQSPVEPPITAIRTIEANSETITLTVSSRGKVQPAMVSEVAAAVSGPVAWISPRSICSPTLLWWVGNRRSPTFP